MTKKFYLLAFCYLLLLKTAQAQMEQASGKPDFKNELGLDFAPFIRGQQGLSLVYKHRIGSVKIKKWHKQSALRLVGGFYIDPIRANNYDYLNNTSYKTTFDPYDANRYFASLGYERQLDRNKFRFYYGGELGYRGGNGQSVSRQDSIVNGVTKPQNVRNSTWTANGPEVSIFSGVNYFFLPHFSIGLEMHLSVGLEFYSSQSVTDNQAPYHYENRTFIGFNELLHLLYLSYRF